ncbi:MAG TPA: ABC transporter ATP-binding protein [Pseudonocardiaceae bacterium]|jgi:ABC-type lipoprotein export system ATPase subunit|nr:ABC transporter ATP-binding protein [Pseudonocardiaceae bacterium]
MTADAPSPNDPRTGLRAATAPAAGLAELGALARSGRTDYGTDALVVCDQLVRIFSAEGVEVQALQGLDLLVSAGELTALVGASGSGKSTLLGILAGLDKPTAGTVRVAGRELAELGPRDWLDYRRHTVGFIWQQTARNLVPYLTAEQNVRLPMRFAGVRRKARRDRAIQLLETVGVGYCRDRCPRQLSGGEQQRVAIATACANNPRLLLADEPTGELDSHTAADVFGALRAVNRDLGTTILIVTHDIEVAGQVDRTVAIRNGRTSTETLREAVQATGSDRREVEYAVLDRNGRLQLPERMTERLGMRDRVRLDEQTDHIAVRPGDGADTERTERT